MNDEALMTDLTKRMLKLAEKNHPVIIIGSAFNVVNTMCNEYPELRPVVTSFMERLAVLYEEPTDQVIVEH
jgi:hypothetical protein